MRLNFFVLLSLFALLAKAAFGPAEMSDLASSTPIIVDAAIKTATVANWTHRNGSAVCGTAFQVEINESFKGQLSGTISFATDGPLSVPGRYLLFLYPSAGSFPSDSIVELTAEEEADYDRCLQELPMLRAWWVTTVEISDGEFAELKTGLILPEALEPFSLDENLVPFDRLREWLATQGG